MKKKKLLHIVESFGGGVFSVLEDLINGLSDEYDITIAYGKRKQTPENFKEKFNDGVKFIEVKNFTRSINPIKDIKSFFEIRTIIKRIQPDIIHLHSSKAGVLGRLAMNEKKVKMFYNPHGFSFLKQDDSKLKRAIYWLIEKITAVINKKCTIVGCSQGEYEEAKKLNRNAVCINNGINIEKIERKIKNLVTTKRDCKDLKICTIGRIGYQKNPEMFNKIAEQFPNIQFTWIGDGELRDKLTSNNIKATGWKERNEVLQLLNDNDVFILTSLWEGLPISLLEAMYMKKICIVSDCIGNRDVIQDGKNGFIANKVEEYIEKIEKIDKTNIDLLDNAYKEIIKKYNTNIMINEYKKLYNKKPVIIHLVNSNIFSGLEKVAIQIIKNLENEFDFYYATKDGKIIEFLKENKVKRIHIDKVSIKEVRRIKKEYDPDIIHAHDFTATVVCAFSNLKVPIISHIHNNPLWIKKILHPYSWVFAISAIRMNKILVVSRAIIDEYVFSNIIKNKVEIIGNPINCNDIIKSLPQKIEKKYDICFVGRLTEQKNPLKFINIINEIRKEIPQIETVMLGDGELKDECQRIIEKLQLQNNIKLLGFKKNVYEYMAESKIFCLTSKVEGFGLVAFEALTLGLPCIVSNVGGLVDIVNNECGSLCSSDKEFINDIIELLRNQEKYDKKSKKAIERAKKIENSEGYYKKIYREYKDLGV